MLPSRIVKLWEVEPVQKTGGKGTVDRTIRTSCRSTCVDTGQPGKGRFHINPGTANPPPSRHLLTLPHCALQTPRVPYGDRHARRSQIYTVPVRELPVATPPFCSEEHPCRDHNRHQICPPIQSVDAGNQAIRWTCPPKSWVRQQTQERRGRRRGEGPSTC
ncbi:hypothetical protein quinque_010011 [Culex quinquefasciatus]